MSTSCKERYHLFKWVCDGLKLEIVPAVAWRGASSAGKPQPLVYHIPQEFFNALQQRLSLGSKKKRLPNFTTGRRNGLTSQSHPTLRELKADFSGLFLLWPAFVRTDGLPLGSFTKYTWHITDLAQVKRIFDTPEVNAHVTSVQPISCSSASPHTHYPPQVPLELSQSFVKNIDGTYSRFRCPEPPPQPEGHRTDRPLPIRPLELRTFLRVGESVYSRLSAAPVRHRWRSCDPLQEQARPTRRRPVPLWSSGSLTCSLAATWESWGSASNTATSRAVSWSSVRKEAAARRTRTCPNPQRPSERSRCLLTQTCVRWLFIHAWRG